jgi:hypothetical protein
MSPTDRLGQVAEADETNLSRSYVTVLLIEVVVLVGLFWLGRHFG